LLEARRIHLQLEVYRRRIVVHTQPVLTFLHECPHDIDSTIQYRQRVDSFLLEADLVLGDPRHVQQVIHQSRQLPDLSGDYVIGPPSVFGR